MNIHRYYMGRHLVRIEHKGHRKAIITHLENGKVGNTKCGYKEVNKSSKDICPIRCLWREKKREVSKLDLEQLKLFPFFHRNNRNNRKIRK